LKELEADQKLKKELPKKKVESDFEELTGLDLSEIREDEEEPESSLDLVLANPSGENKLVTISGKKEEIENRENWFELAKEAEGSEEPSDFTLWKKFVKKAEKRLDYQILFHPKQVEFVNAEGY